jgi:hypothetical protein
LHPECRSWNATAEQVRETRPENPPPDWDVNLVIRNVTSVLQNSHWEVNLCLRNVTSTLQNCRLLHFVIIKHKNNILIWDVCLLIENKLKS